VANRQMQVAILSVAESEVHLDLFCTHCNVIDYPS